MGRNYQLMWGLILLPILFLFTLLYPICYLVYIEGLTWEEADKKN